MTFIDLDKIAADTLQNLRRTTQADYVAITVPDEGWKPLRAAWGENRISRDLLEPAESALRALVLSGGNSAVQKIDGSEVWLSVFPMRFRELAGCTITLAWRDDPLQFNIASGQSLVDMAALALENAYQYQTQQYYIQSLEYLG